VTIERVWAERGWLYAKSAEGIQAKPGVGEGGKGGVEGEAEAIPEGVGADEAFVADRKFLPADAKEPAKGRRRVSASELGVGESCLEGVRRVEVHREG
jgi:hypothetical protein